MSSHASDLRSDSSVEHQVRELQILLPRLMAGYKRTTYAAREMDPLGEAFQAAGLGPRHGHALIQLGVHGEQSVTELAERLHVTRTTASLMVAELSRAGVVTRREDDADRRRTIVGIAEDYRAVVDQALERNRAPIRAVLAELSPEEGDQLVACLGRLVAEFDAAAGAGTDESCPA